MFTYLLAVEHGVTGIYMIKYDNSLFYFFNCDCQNNYFLLERYIYIYIYKKCVCVCVSCKSSFVMEPKWSVGFHKKKIGPLASAFQFSQCVCVQSVTMFQYIFTVYSFYFEI